MHSNVIRPLFGLLILLISSVASSQINNANYRITTTSNDLGPCGGTNDAFTFVNILSKTSDSNAFEISFMLPDGVSYIPTSLEISDQEGSSDFVINDITVDPNAPRFTIQRPSNANWQVSDRVRLRFLKTADCDAVQFSYNGGLFKDAHSITYNNSSGTQNASDTDQTINSYNFLNPLLSVINYDNSSAQIQENVTKTVEINNSGNGTIETFKHEATVDSALDNAYSLSYNGTVLTPTNIAGGVYTYQIDLNVSPFLGTVGDGDAAFEENESIVLDESFRVEACGTHSIWHQSEWGCSSSQICQTTSPISGSVEVSSDAPILAVRELTTFGRVDYLNGATYEAEMVNDGSVPAYNLNLNTGIADFISVRTSSTENGLWGNDGPDPSKILSNFIFTATGTPMVTETVTHTQFTGRGAGSFGTVQDSDYGSPGLDPDGPGGLEDLDGDGFFDDLAPGASTRYSFDMNFSSLNPSCGTEAARYIRNWLIQSHVYGQNQCGTEIAATEIANFGDGLFSRRTLSVSRPSDVFDGQSFTVGLAGGMVAGAKDAPNCNGERFFSNSSDTSWEATMTVPDGVSLDPSAPAEFSTTGPNTVRYFSTSLDNSDVLEQDVQFPLVFNCGGLTSGEVDFPYTITYRNPCLTQEVYCGTTAINVICSANCDGPSLLNFDANRVTAGFTDNSMNTRVTLDPTVHATNFYGARDEMLITAEGTVQTFSVDNLHFDLTFRTLENGGDIDLFEFLPSTDPSAIIKSEIIINGTAFDISSMPTLSDEGGRNYRMRFDLSSFAASYDPGDNFEVRLKFLWGIDFNSNIIFDIENFRGEYFYFDSGGTKISCFTLGDEAKYVRPTVFTQPTDILGDGCSIFEDSSRLAFRANSSTDPFPNEFRPIYLWRSTTTNIPNGTDLVGNMIRTIGYESNATVANGQLDFSQTGNAITVTPNIAAGFRHNDFIGNGDPELRVSLRGSLETPTNATTSYDITYDVYAYSDYPETRVRTQTKNFGYSRPTFTIDVSNPVVIGNEPEVTYELEICKTSTSDSPFNWLQLGDNGNFIVTEAVEVVGGMENTIPFSADGTNTWFQIGAFDSSTSPCKTIRFTGNFDSCTNFDMTVENSWSCEAYPINSLEYSSATYTNPVNIRLEPQEATLQLQIIDEPTTSIEVCTDFNIELELRNAGSGNLIDPSFTFDIPGDITGLSIDRIIVEYPRGSGETQKISSSLTGNLVTVNIAEHTLIAANQGIMGASRAANLNEQIAIIELVLNPTCDFTSNSAITFSALGNNPCSTAAQGNGVRLNSAPLQLTGAEADYSTINEIILDNGPVLQGCVPHPISVRSTVIDSGPTSSADIARIILPDGLTFDLGSFMSPSAFSASNPSIRIVDNHEEIDINMPDGASNGDIIVYNFDVLLKDEPNVCNPNASIVISNFKISDALSCGGVPCSNTRTSVGSSSAEVTLAKPILSSSGSGSALYSTTDDGSNRYEMTFEIENTSAIDLDVGALYSVFCANSSGVKIGNSIYSGSLSQLLPGNGMITENVIFTSNSLCADGGSVLIEMIPSDTNCHCEPLSILIAGTERTADIALDLSTNSTIVDSGEEISLIHTLSNSGPFDVQDIMVESNIPSGFSVESADDGGTQTDTSSVIWTVPILLSGETITLNLILTANTPTGTSDEFTIISQVIAADGNDPDSTPNNYDPSRPLEDDEAVIQLTSSSTTDIEILKSADRTESTLNDEVNFTITATNIGIQDASSIGIDDMLPDGFEFISATADKGTYDQTIGEWTIADLSVDEAATLTVTARVVKGIDYTNIATLAFVSPIDINIDNDTAQVTIIIDDSDCITVFNEFSPNDDGANDFFYIDCIENYPNNLLRVYNRWGNEVFSAEGYDNRWDGTSTNEFTIGASRELPVGTYYYTLELGEEGLPAKSGWLYISK